jgi:hypothetical protein
LFKEVKPFDHSFEERQVKKDIVGKLEFTYGEIEFAYFLPIIYLTDP